MTRPPQLKPALLLAAHGTRDPAGVAAFAALASRVEDLAGRDGTRVAGGFIELSEPALREAVAGLPPPPPRCPPPPQAAKPAPPPQAAKPAPPPQAAKPAPPPQAAKPAWSRCR